MIGIDQTVTKVGVAAAGAATTPVITTTQNVLLLAFVSTDGPSDTVSGVANSGTALAWILAGRTNTQSGTAEVWRTQTSAGLASQTVTATATLANANVVLAVVSLTGTDLSGTNGSAAIGATGTANNAAAAPSVSLTTTRANSWMWAIGFDFDTATNRTVPTGQVIVFQSATNAETTWVQRTVALTASVGTSVTINDTAPTADRFNFTAVEILPAMPSFRPNNLRPHPFSPGLSR